MNRTPFQIWLWREFKKAFSEASLKTKLAFALPLIVAILFVIVNPTHKNSDSYGVLDMVDVETSEDFVDILDMNRFEMLEEKKSAHAKLMNQKTVLVSLVNSEKGIVINTDPFGLNPKDGLIIEVVDSIFKGSKPGRLLILEIEEQKGYLHKLPNKPSLNKLQETSYALHGH